MRIEGFTRFICDRCGGEELIATAEADERTTFVIRNKAGENTQVWELCAPCTVQFDSFIRPVKSVSEARVNAQR